VFGFIFALNKFLVFINISYFVFSHYIRTQKIDSGNQINSGDKIDFCKMTFIIIKIQNKWDNACIQSTKDFRTQKIFLKYLHLLLSKGTIVVLKSIISQV
jgi:hypothetical protein